MMLKERKPDEADSASANPNRYDDSEMSRSENSSAPSPKSKQNTVEPKHFPRTFTHDEVMNALNNEPGEYSEDGTIPPLFILCGKDKTYQQRSQGNKVFRTIILRSREAYNVAKSKFYKMQITKDIVKTLADEYNAFFIKPAKDDTSWKELTILEARDKTSHALRFAYTKNLLPTPDTTTELPWEPSLPTAKAVEATATVDKSFKKKKSYNRMPNLTIIGDSVSGCTEKTRKPRKRKGDTNVAHTAAGVSCRANKKVRHDCKESGAPGSLDYAVELQRFPVRSFASSQGHAQPIDLIAGTVASVSEQSNRSVANNCSAATSHIIQLPRSNINQSMRQMQKSSTHASPRDKYKNSFADQQTALQQTNVSQLSAQQEVVLHKENSFIGSRPTGGVLPGSAACSFTVDQKQDYPDSEVEQNSFPDLGLQETWWQAMFKKLVRYKVINGNTDVLPMDNDKQLWNWVNHQRLKMSMLQSGMPCTEVDQRHISQLNSIGFQWASSSDLRRESIKTYPDENWDKLFRRLQLYVEIHGNANVPPDFVDRELMLWVSIQRVNISKIRMGLACEAMSHAKINKLDSVGINWVQPCSDPETSPVESPLLAEHNDRMPQTSALQVLAGSAAERSSVLPQESLKGESQLCGMNSDPHYPVITHHDESGIAGQQVQAMDRQEAARSSDQERNKHLLMLLEKRRAQAKQYSALQNHQQQINAEFENQLFRERLLVGPPIIPGNRVMENRDDNQASFHAVRAGNQVLFCSMPPQYHPVMQHQQQHPARVRYVVLDPAQMAQLQASHGLQNPVIMDSSRTMGEASSSPEARPSLFPASEPL